MSYPSWLISINSEKQVTCILDTSLVELNNFIALYVQCPTVTRWNLKGWHRRFIGSLPTVTLNFYLLTLKSNHDIYEPKYICDQNWVKFPSLVFETWCSEGFWDAQTHTLTDRHTWKQYTSGTDGFWWQRHRNTQVRYTAKMKVRCYRTRGQ